ncbi:hypothetical protein MHY87_01460 [Microvirga sp. ACRRW]|uniref:hypothetical protein n=1 Tax=Microvirga sp. ACRRW TaxID=2918205 RepID=UPI001EF4E9C5|nr:hypothetical protein [Microvirga sp. ACRRW]MCG7391575.1 hypothetical protein [Microvirga sp. ACRRW]
MTVSDLMRSLWRYKYVMVIAVLLFGAAAAGGMLMRPPEYEVRASMLLRFDNNYYAKNPVSEGWEGDPVRVELANAVSTELSLLGSQSVLRAALRSMGGKEAWKASEPTNQYREWIAGHVKPLLANLSTFMPAFITAQMDKVEDTEDQALSQIRERISIKMAEGTSVASVEMHYSNPDFAVRFVNALLTEYLAFRSSLFPDTPVEKLAAQAADANQRLLAAETNLVQMKSKLGIVDPDAERSALLSGKARLQMPDPERSTNRAELRQVQSQRTLQLRLVERRLAELSQADAAIMPLKLAVEQAKGDADRANRAYQRARLSADSSIDQSIRVVDPATSTDKPVGLSVAAAALLGGLAGLALSFALAAIDAVRRAGRRRHEHSYGGIAEYGWSRPTVVLSLPQFIEPSARSHQTETDRATS